MDACTSRYQYSALTTKTREKPITKLLEVFVTVCTSLDYTQYCLRRDACVQWQETSSTLLLQIYSSLFAKNGSNKKTKQKLNSDV